MRNRQNAGKKWHLRLVGREREKFQEIKNDKGMIGRVTVILLLVTVILLLELEREIKKL